MAHLSPLLRSGLAFTALLAHEAGRMPEATHALPKQVSAWACGECGDLHHREDDAFECCAPGELRGKGFLAQGSVVVCPVCRQASSDYHEAADCCLWKDIAAPARWRIADAVEAGATWSEAIEASTN